MTEPTTPDHAPDPRPQTPVATPDQVVGWLRACTDPLGFEQVDYLERLDYGRAREFLTADATREEFDAERRPLARQDLLDTIRAYLPFAWEKADGQRGISAYRSIRHFHAWMRMAGDAEAAAAMAAKSDGYGQASLHFIETYYGWETARETARKA